MRARKWTLQKTCLILKQDSLSPRLHFNLTLSPSLLAINITRRAALSLMPSLSSPLPIPIYIHPYSPPLLSFTVIRPSAFSFPSPATRRSTKRGRRQPSQEPRPPAGGGGLHTFFRFPPASKKVEGRRRLLLLGKRCGGTSIPSEKEEEEEGMTAKTKKTFPPFLHFLGRHVARGQLSQSPLISFFCALPFILPPLPFRHRQNRTCTVCSSVVVGRCMVR